jgi:hypothetical protein
MNMIDCTLINTRQKSVDKISNTLLVDVVYESCGSTDRLADSLESGQSIIDF